MAVVFRKRMVAATLGLAVSHVFGAGAKVPFVTLEAEAGRFAGAAAAHVFTPGSAIPKVATLELEASGGGYARLEKEGDAISWNNPVEGANAIVVRSSLPDTAEGGGITATLNLYVDGVFRQAVELSSKQSWVYRTPKSGWIDDPRQGGMPFKFYNEDRAFLVGPPLRAGAVVMLRKDKGNAAAHYDIDCVDIEPVAPPSGKTEGVLSVVDFGALGDGKTDAQAAIQKCLDEARKTGKPVYFPAGTYLTNTRDAGPLDFTGLTVRGAGRWHTTIYRAFPTDVTPKTRSYCRVGTNTVLSDLTIDSNSNHRGLHQAGGGDYGVIASGEHWRVERIWVRHTDANWMSGSFGLIRDCRVADTWGDGINLNNGNTPDPHRAGIHLTAENNFVRGTGDDGLATYSDRGASGQNTQMSDTSFINNTSVAVYWANALRVAGGRNVVVRGNLLMDPSSNSGLTIGVFGDSGHPVESCLAEDNVILRGGGWNGTDRHGLVVDSRPDAYSVVTLRNNTIQDARRAGVYIGKTFETLTLDGNQILHPATAGIEIARGVTGTATLKDNVAKNLNAGQPDLQNNSASTFKVSRR